MCGGGAEQEGEGKGGGNKMISFAYGELEWELAGHIQTGSRGECMLDLSLLTGSPAPDDFHR